MKRKLRYIFVTLIFVLVFASQIIQVKAITRYDDYDSFDEDGLVMDCQASIWAGPKAGGGYYMNRQYFNVDIDTESGCGICTVTITLTIQGDVVFDEEVIDNGLLNPDWGPDSVYYNFWNYYEYETSNYAVWAEVSVWVVYMVGSSYDIGTMSAEASFGS